MGNKMALQSIAGGRRRNCAEERVHQQFYCYLHKTRSPLYIKCRFILHLPRLPFYGINVNVNGLQNYRGRGKKKKADLVGVPLILISITTTPPLSSSSSNNGLYGGCVPLNGETVKERNSNVGSDSLFEINFIAITLSYWHDQVLITLFMGVLFSLSPLWNMGWK